MEDVKKDLLDSDIDVVLSDAIRRDALKKFAYVSPAAVCGEYYDAVAGDMQKSGEIRDTFAGLIGEIDTLAKAMGLTFDMDIVQTNLDILDGLSPQASTSMQRDIAAGKSSEVDGLVYEVVRMGERYGVKLPLYEKIAAALQERGLK